MRFYWLHDDQWELNKYLLPGRVSDRGVTARDSRIFKPHPGTYSRMDFDVPARNNVHDATRVRQVAAGLSGPRLTWQDHALFSCPRPGTPRASHSKSAAIRYLAGRTGLGFAAIRAHGFPHRPSPGAASTECCRVRRTCHGQCPPFERARSCRIPRRARRLRLLLAAARQPRPAVGCRGSTATGAERVHRCALQDAHSAASVAAESMSAWPAPGLIKAFPEKHTTRA